MITSYFEEEKIELHITRGHPAFAERSFRTVKDKLFKWIENDEKKGKDHCQWIDYITEIMRTYNDKDVHSATGLTPKEARKPRNDAKAKISRTIGARKTRMYPELTVNDNLTHPEESHNWKGKHITLAERHIFKVVRIEKKLGQENFFVEGRGRGLLRRELLKV